MSQIKNTTEEVKRMVLNAICDSGYGVMKIIEGEEEEYILVMGKMIFPEQAEHEDNYGMVEGINVNVLFTGQYTSIPNLLRKLTNLIEQDKIKLIKFSSNLKYMFYRNMNKTQKKF